MDTFRIKIKNYTATDPGYFDEIKSSSFASNQRYKRDRTNTAYRNKMVKEGVYIPKYAISEVNFGNLEKALELEFSAGKLIHGTNQKDVSEKNLPLVVEKLSEFLKSIKVQTPGREIENATTTLAAYAQNIPVDQFGSVQEIIRVIAPFDYRPRSKFTIGMDEKGGAELKYFNKNSHLTLYAKLPEIRNNAVTKEEFAIIDYLDHGTNKEIYESWVRETLRAELTLHSKVAVKQALSEFYGKKTDFTLTEAFSDNVHDTLLRREIDNVFNHPLQKIVILTSFDRGVFNQVIEKYCKTLAQRREMRVALDILYARGLSAYREDVLSKASERTWFRNQKRLKQICDTIQLPRGAVKHINNAEFLEYFLSQFGIKSKLRESKQEGLF
jgi:RNase P protein component